MASPRWRRSGDGRSKKGGKPTIFFLRGSPGQGTEKVVVAAVATLDSRFLIAEKLL